MRSNVLKSLGKVVLAGLLLAGCGEPIPVDLTKATGPCEDGAKLMTDGMMMVIQDGRLTVVPKDEREVRAFWPEWGGTTTGGTTTDGTGTTNTTSSTTDCSGCH